MHGCPRQNPAYRRSAESEAEMLRFSASEPTSRYGTPYGAAKASKAKAMLAFVFEPSKTKDAQRLIDAASTEIHKPALRRVCVLWYYS